MISFRIPFVVGLLCALLSCKNDDDDTAPIPINEEEVITTVLLELTNSSNQEKKLYTWDQTLNADTPPEIVLDQETTYTAVISFLDASIPTTPKDITAEIIAEKDSHLIYFAPENSLENLTIVSNSDDTKDSQNIGIQRSTTWASGSISNGILTVYLIHTPTNKTGKTREAIGGETDVEVQFSVQVKAK